MTDIKKRAAHSKYTDDMPTLWVAAIEEHKTITHACRALGISRETFYRWCREHPEMAEARKEGKDTVLDIVESKLFKAIEQGNMTAIIYYLNNQGASRGYSNRQELTGADGQPLVPTITFGGTLPPDEDSKL